MSSPSPPADTETSHLRRWICALVIAAASAISLAQIMRVKAPLSSNDTSRWLTVRALVERGSYVLGERQPNQNGGYEDRALFAKPNWWSIDMVLDPTSNHFLSDKPPLLPTVVAGVCWLTQRLTGWTFTDDAPFLMRVALILLNFSQWV